MKTKLLLISIFILSLSQAQHNNIGFDLSTHSGVYSINNNPASFLGSSKDWSFNLISAAVNVENNKVEFNMNDVIKNVDTEELIDKLLSNGGTITSNQFVDIVGPSFSINFHPKHSMGIITRSRIMSTLNDIDANLINSIRNIEINSDLFPYDINSLSNQIISVNAWSEIGANYAMEIFGDEENSLTLGATFKYLLGSANSYININNLKGTIGLEKYNNNTKAYLTNASADLTFVSSGFDFITGNIDLSKLTEFNGRGIGGDIGIVYEFKNLKENKYHLRVGVSLLDIGSIKYKPEAKNAYSYSINIPNNNNFYLDELSGSLLEIQDILKNSPYFKYKDVREEYSAGLPTSLSLFADYNLFSNFYLAASAKFNVSDFKNSPQNAFYSNTYSLLPRFETKYFGFYLPVNYNEISSLSIGTGLRLGPLFIGSGSILSALMSKTKKIDFFVGLRFGS